MVFYVLNDIEIEYKGLSQVLLGQALPGQALPFALEAQNKTLERVNQLAHPLCQANNR